MKISQYNPLTSPAPGDELVIVDTDDHTMASSGTTKNITVANLGLPLTPSGDITGVTDTPILLAALNNGLLYTAASTTPFWINAPLVYRNGASVIGQGEARSSSAAIIKQAAGANLVAPGTPALNGRGVWKSGTIYAANDAVLIPVMPNYAFYTSANPRGNFAASTVYAVNDVVYNSTADTLVYICIAGYTSSATTPDADTTHWMQVATALYRCILGLTSTTTPDTDATHWSLVQPTGLLVAYEWLNNVAAGGQPANIENVQFDGNRTNNPYSTACGVIMQNFWSGIRRNMFQNMPLQGILLTDTTLNGTTVSATGSENKISENKIQNVTQDAIRVVSATNTSNLDGFITDCLISGTGLGAVNIDRMAGWKVFGNHIYGIGGNGITGGAAFASKVIENYIEDFGDQNAPSFFYTGIGITQLNGRATHVGRNFVGCNDPAVNSSHYQYISLSSGVSQTTARAIVTDNAINGPAVTSNSIGLVLQNGSGGTLTAVADGNQVVSTATETFIQTGVVVASKNYGSATLVGQIDVATAGVGLQVAEGSNAKQGTATLNGTTAVVVSNTSVTANSRIFLTINLGAGTVGSPYVSARSAGASFSIKSTTVGDTSTVAYEIVEPG